ncbi:hypothetical protein FIBSPDRAFT_939300 [Athelia psychrophila]|uniref:G-protein coupled receptors family 1 profile domain-containing protein n=1 Tax=Athelia psychrophila TaxID=1759441 RepID=A0A165WQT4_9AGAM|nr:hypothetical protein FIBSPDRAFT_939300 [Fibularhizoctonia sp. CBS 109695]
MAANNTTAYLTRYDSIGLAFVVESAFLSLIAVLAAFVLLIRNAFRDGYLIKRPANLYMISLFAFDLVMAVGHVLDVKWVHDGQVEVGHYCTAQGAIKQFGELGSSLSTLAIAIHTFVVVIWGKLGNNFSFAYCIVALNWLFVIFFVALGLSLNKNSSWAYETPVGFWCWIGTKYRAEQFAGEYVWLWVTMFVSFITYTLIFLWARGNLTVNSTRWWDIRIHRTLRGRVNTSGGKTRSVKMIAYPIVFAILVLPLSVVRFRSGFGRGEHNVPNALTFTVQILYSLSGAVNVTLFLTTRSSLLLPKSTHWTSIALWQPSADSNAENGQGQSRESRTSDGGYLSLRHSNSTDMRPVERGDRPIGLTALPVFKDGSEDW